MKEVMFDLVTDLGIEYMGYYRLDFSDYDYYLSIEKDKAIGAMWSQDSPVYLSGSSFDWREFDIIKYNDNNYNATKIDISEAPKQIKQFILKEMI